MNNQHEVELNLFYLHWNDAKKFAEWADNNVDFKSLYARHSILSCVFAIEAMINKIVNDFYLLPTGRESFQKLSLKEKVFSSPLVCGKEKPIGICLDQSRDPFQSFSELVDIRNWLVHPKRGSFVDAKVVFGSVHIATTGEDIPFVETDFSKVWPHTRFPVNPFELTEQHARQTINITEKLISEIKTIFDGLLTDKWFEEIILRSKDGKHKKTLTIQSLWGGYTPQTNNSN